MKTVDPVKPFKISVIVEPSSIEWSPPPKGPEEGKQDETIHDL